MTDTLAPTPSTVTAPLERTKPGKPAKAPRKKKLQREDIAATFDALADLLEAGSPEKTALKDIAEQYHGTTAGAAYAAAHALMGTGKRMRDALAAQDQLFPRVAREMIASAKTTPDMVNVLHRSAKQLKDESNIKRTVVTSLLHPAGLAIMVVAVFGFFALYLGPTLGDNTEVMGPGFGVVLDIISTAFWITIAAVALAALGGGGFWAYWVSGGRKNARLVARMDRFALRIRGFGEVLKLDAAARFCEVAGSALTAGRSEVEALRAAADACGNAAVGEHISNHASRMKGREGAIDAESPDLARSAGSDAAARSGAKKERLTFDAVAESPLFPWMLTKRLALTSSQKQRNAVLLKLGDEFRTQSLQTLSKTSRRMTTTFENIVLVVVMALTISIAIPIGLSLTQMGSLLG